MGLVLPIYEARNSLYRRSAMWPTPLRGREHNAVVTRHKRLRLIRFFTGAMDEAVGDPLT
jgi:hypothetical protein